MNSGRVNNTIAAIATGLGESGIGIVRVSGPEALAVADKIFAAKDGRKPSQYKTYTVHYGWIVDPANTENVEGRRSKVEGNCVFPSTFHLPPSTDFIDEVLLTIMRSPRSYTKEDVIEISCHGGIVAMRRVLELALENGCSLAAPGEFTKRAFLNGRIDLAQAEAVLDIIRAKTDSSLDIAVRQLKGGLSRQVHKIRDGLLEILCLLEAGIDFPEEDTGSAEYADMLRRLCRLDEELRRMIESGRRGQIMREGIQAVICGLPNVGKSSLLNALLKQERSIVTPVAGTTRDAIEEIIDIRGIPVRIVDTAGIIEPRDLVEKKAVQRARKYMDSADLVILVFDGTKTLSRQDKMLIRRLKNKKVLAVINKSDLKLRIEKESVLEKFPGAVILSAKRPKEIALLEEAIAGIFYAGKTPVREAELVANLRHIEALRQAQKLVAEAQGSLDNKLSPEFVAQSLREALDFLDRVLGVKFSEDLLDKIFSSFCIGK